MNTRRICYALAVLGLVAATWSTSGASTRRILPLSNGDDTTAVGMADSSVWKPTAQYQRIYLDLQPSRPCRIAIAVYEAAASDSSAVPGLASAPAALDTINVVVWPWRGGAEASAGADTLSFRETLSPTADQAASYEAIYEFPAAAAGKWGSVRARKIALRGPDGTWYTGDFTRIRVRVLSASGVVTWVRRDLKGYAW